MFYIFIIIALDIASLVLGSRAFGIINILFLVMIFGFIGMWLMVNQGWLALRRMQTQPIDIAISRSLLTLLAGILFITPGFFSDVLAFICIFPPTSFFLAKYLQLRLAKNGGVFTFGRFSNSQGFGGSGSFGQPTWEDASNSSSEFGRRPVRDVTPPSEKKGEVHHIPANRRNAE